MNYMTDKLLDFTAAAIDITNQLTYRLQRLMKKLQDPNRRDNRIIEEQAQDIQRWDALYQTTLAKLHIQQKINAQLEQLLNKEKIEP